MRTIQESFKAGCRVFQLGCTHPMRIVLWPPEITILSMDDVIDIVQSSQDGKSLSKSIHWSDQEEVRTVQLDDFAQLYRLDFLYSFDQVSRVGEAMLQEFTKRCCLPQFGL